MEVVEYSSGHKILHSNSVILFDKKADLELRIKMSETFSFNLKLIFEEGRKEDISRKVDESTNTISFTMGDEFAKQFGPESNIYVADFENKKIFFQYTIKKLYSGEYKKIDYTLFEG